MRVGCLAAAGTLVLCLAACGSSGERTVTVTAPAPTLPAPSTTASTTTQTQPEQTRTVTLYFLDRGELAAVHRDIHATPAIGTATVRALLEGPNVRERGFNLSTGLLTGTELKSLTIANGVATAALDPPPDEPALAQVVYTLTQFPTVRSVRVGKSESPAYTRRSALAGLPAILVDSPGFGDTVTSPLRITGTSNTFEATYSYEVVVDDKIVHTGFGTATSGTGQRGTFDETIEFPVARAANGELVVFERSAANGKRIHIREIPLRFEP